MTWDVIVLIGVTGLCTWDVIVLIGVTGLCTWDVIVMIGVTRLCTWDVIVLIGVTMLHVWGCRCTDRYSQRHPFLLRPCFFSISSLPASLLLSSLFPFPVPSLSTHSCLNQSRLSQTSTSLLPLTPQFTDSVTVFCANSPPVCTTTLNPRPDSIKLQECAHHGFRVTLRW